MIRLGLTGSIGMGKSTTTKLFADQGIPVWDADAAVHRLYGPGAEGSRAIAALAPGTVSDEGVDRARLRAAIAADPALLPRVEAAIHPLVAEDRQRFLEDAERRGAAAALCDIPLLFETGGDAGFDAVIVVSAPADVQRKRVLARPGMDKQTFQKILARQTTDAEKRARADHVIDTSGGIDAARDQVVEILEKLGLK